MDDGLSCADTVEQAVDVLHQTVEALKRCNIRLHKILSSSDEVVQAFPESERAVRSTRELEENANQAALGLIWDTVTDNIIVRTDILERPFTRRGILATLHSVF